MDEEIETERGKVKASFDERDKILKIDYDLKDVNWDDDKDIQDVVEAIQEIDLKDPYAQSYQEQLDTSFVMYGREGVKTQLGYIASNCEDEDLANDIDEIRKLL